MLVQAVFYICLREAYEFFLGKFLNVVHKRYCLIAVWVLYIMIWTFDGELLNNLIHV